MTLTKYPDFQQLDIGHLGLFVQACEYSHPYISELTFTNLYSWRKFYDISVCALEDLFIVRSGSQKSARFFLPLGKTNPKNAIVKIMKETAGNFIRLPQEPVEYFRANPLFVINEDRDNADYLYRSEDLINLAGRKYDGKRNLIKKFKAEHNYEYVKLESSNASICLDFEEVWCSIKNCDRVEGLSHERFAIREMVANFSIFGLIGGAIKIDGEIVALALAQMLRDDTFVVHILKADPNITGLYQVMMQEFLAREAKRFAYVNLEQDLGIEGLRKSKLSYHPWKIINKYSLGLA